MHIERRRLLGVALTSMSTLTLEVALTRIFSVTMGYHFAFLAISLALMGSAIAGVVLYFSPGLARPDRARRWMALASLVLSISVPLTFATYLHIPFQVTPGRGGFLSGEFIWLTLICLDLTIPFFLSGFILSLALSTWPRHVGPVYWADLTGASLGCLLSMVALGALGGAGAVLAVGVVSALAGLAFTWRMTKWQTLAVLAVLVLASLVWANAQYGWITVSARKAGREEHPRVYERWNAYSRVTVYEVKYFPFFWSVDEHLWDKTIQEGRFLNHALLLIDAVAGSPIQEFRGVLSDVEFLQYDLTSFVYHLMDGPRTLVIGPGGGRDVLAALASGAPHVTAVEVNPIVIAAVRGPFSDFAGHLYERPDVTIAVDDARGYIARSPQMYDVIQASLIDTWAAGGSGAFALSENSLYTVEAFQTYYDHLTDSGVLSVSRWYLTERPAETLRLISTAMAGWARAGIADPRQHVAVVARPNVAGQSEGLATALFKRTPFTVQEVAALKEKAQELGFTLLYAPGLQPRDVVGQFIASEDHAAFVAAYPLDVSPASDDRPFFFNLVRLGDLLDVGLTTSGVYRTSVEALWILGAVLGVTAVSGALFVLLPLWLGGRRRGLARPPGRLLGYFGAVGAAFMLVEIPTIQRLTVYLGRPAYSLAVVLFSLLLFSGLGSLWTGRPARELSLRLAGRLFPVLVALVALHAVAAGRLLHATMGWPLTARLGLTVALLAPLGLLMGVPFPLGMRWAGKHYPRVLPWLWGVNGVMSVLGSALSTAIAIHVGFRVTLLVATALYGLAGVALAREARCTGVSLRGSGSLD